MLYSCSLLFDASTCALHKSSCKSASYQFAVVHKLAEDRVPLKLQKDIKKKQKKTGSQTQRKETRQSQSLMISQGFTYFISTILTPQTQEVVVLLHTLLA